MSDETELTPAPIEIATPPTPEPHSLRWVFIGSEGLRSGWGVLLFFIFAGFVIYALAFVLRPFHPLPQKAPPGMKMNQTLIGEVVSFTGFAVAAWLLSLIERRPFGVYGLGGPSRLRDLAEGLAIGILAITLLIGILWSAHLLVFDSLALHGSIAILDGLRWALAFLFVGLLEEFMTRGYIQFTVTRGIGGLIRSLNPDYRTPYTVGFWITATLFSALLFMGLHLSNHGETAVGILAVGAAGLTFAYSLWRTGTLWWAIGFHAAWDWGQTYLYGVADSGNVAEGHLLNSHPMGDPMLSGGTAGPEGSIFVLLVLALVCVVIHLTLPRRDATL